MCEVTVNWLKKDPNQPRITDAVLIADDTPPKVSTMGDHLVLEYGKVHIEFICKNDHPNVIFKIIISLIRKIGF